VNADPFRLRELVGAQHFGAQLNTKLDGLKKDGTTMKVGCSRGWGRALPPLYWRRLDGLRRLAGSQSQLAATVALCRAGCLAAGTAGPGGGVAVHGLPRVPLQAVGRLASGQTVHPPRLMQIISGSISGSTQAGRCSDRKPIHLTLAPDTAYLSADSGRFRNHSHKRILQPLCLPPPPPPPHTHTPGQHGAAGPAALHVPPGAPGPAQHHHPSAAG
jgi:hypothetical protein